MGGGAGGAWEGHGRVRDWQRETLGVDEGSRAGNLGGWADGGRGAEVEGV